MVPDKMLSPAKLDPAEAEKLLGKGQDFHGKRQAAQDQRDEHRVKLGQARIEVDRLTPGMPVKYLVPGLFAHTTTFITEVHFDEGKVTVVNPKADLLRKMTAAGVDISVLGKRAAAQDTVRVWAFQVEPV